MTPYESNVSASSPPTSRTTAFARELRNRERSVDLPAPASASTKTTCGRPSWAARQSFFEDAQFGLAPHEADRSVHGG